jgi:hypothetical protein
LIISGRRIIPIETPELPEEPDTASILYNEMLTFSNTIAMDPTIFSNPMVPARHVFFKERVLAFGIFLVTCCYRNIDLGLDITDKHREKLSESKIQSQVDTYMADLHRAFQVFKVADEKARKKHRFDNTAALDEMIPHLLGELNSDKGLDTELAAREHIFDFLDVLNSYEI